ncbi:hypothetical protein Q9L58_008483 [Maublancomyces gigas]|uniref:protein disulfide-isomerase n=1 Tax=Discina gigas TaxID=1032678 RepID=A0ABR3GA53_9PEZI
MVLLRELGLVAFLALTHSANALYSKGGAVLNLDEKGFKKEILLSENVAIVEFYAPWCGHCKSLKPEYEKTAKALKGLVKVAAVNCDEEKNKALCSQQGVKGFPTLKIFQPSAKKGKPIVNDYQGARTAKAMSDALVEIIPNHVTRVTASKIDEFLTQKNETAKAILFTNKGVTSALWKALAIDFLGSISFAQIRDKEKKAIDIFGISEYPTIVVLPGGDKEGIVYSGKVQKDDLFKFFSAIAPPKKEPEPSPKSSKKTPKKDKKSKKGEEERNVKEETETKTDEAIILESEKPKPLVPELADQAALTEACLSPKSKTCILAIAPAESTSNTLQNIYETLTGRTVSAFKVYKLLATSAHAVDLATKLDLAKDTTTKFIAINAKRNWVRKFAGNADSEEEVLAWLDAVRLGDGAREKLPAGLVVEEEEEEERKEEKHDEL